MGGALRCSHKTCFVSGELNSRDILRCALTRTCEPHPHAADVDGAVLVKARHDTETKYPELISDEVVEFIRLLACAKAQEVPSHMWWPTTLA